MRLGRLSFVVLSLILFWMHPALADCGDDLGNEGKAHGGEDSEKQVGLFWMKHFTLLNQIDKLFPLEAEAKRVATDIGLNAIASEEIRKAVTKLESKIRTKLRMKPGNTIVIGFFGLLTEVHDDYYEPNKVPIFRPDGSMEMVLETERPPKRTIVMLELGEGAKIGVETTDYKQEYLPPPVQEALRTMLLVLAASTPYRIHPQILEFCNERFMTLYKVLRAFKAVGDKALERHQASGGDIYDAWEASNSHLDNPDKDE